MDNKKIAIIACVFLISIFFVSMSVAKISPRAVAECRDGYDNDYDGLVDYPNDPGCSSRNDKSELNPNIECDDGGDNDGDSAIDMNDLGCSSPTDNDETNCGDTVCEGGETQYNCPLDCGYPDSCDETDGGNVITVYGTSYGYLNNSYYSDNDYCVNVDDVMEYWCSGSYEQNQQQSCGTDFYSSQYCIGDYLYSNYTDYYCSGGSCGSNNTPQMQQYCGSDGYGETYCVYDYYVYKNYTDNYCGNETCGSTVTPEYQEYCPAGCLNGQCITINDSCYDTDGGIVLPVFGNVSGYYMSSPYSYADFCMDSTSLMEYYCSGNYAYSINTTCSGNYTMCSAGRCV